MRFRPYAILMLFMLLAGSAYAQPNDIDHASFEAVGHGFNQFYNYLTPFIQRVVTSSALKNSSEMSWRFFAAILIAWEMSMFSLRAIQFPDLFKIIFLITITHVLMVQFDTITTALWEWSESLSTAIQVSAIGVNDQFFAPRFIWNLVTSFSWSNVGYFMLHPVNVILMIGVSLSSFLLSAISFITLIWGLWGYSLAKMIGLIFIPTILFEQLSWLFNGWLRFFFGFLVYNILAKAALMLVVIAMAAYAGLSPSSIPTGVVHQFTDHSFMETLSLFIFFLLSIFGLLSTGKFVSTIVGGASVCIHKSISDGAMKIASLLK